MLRNLALAAVVVIVSSSQASAAPIYQMTGGTQTSGQEFTYGFDFTPVQDITVDALGFWDFGADGLSDVTEDALKESVV